QQLAGAEKTLEQECLRMLDEENRSLLEARPGARPPRDSSEKWRQLVERFGREAAKTWSQVARATDARKAAGLCRLVAGGPPSAGALGPFSLEYDYHLDVDIPVVRKLVVQPPPVVVPPRSAGPGSTIVPPVVIPPKVVVDTEGYRIQLRQLRDELQEMRGNL